MLAATWTQLAATAGAVAKARPSPLSSTFALARDILRVAATLQPATESSDIDYNWPHWSPSPRIEAIQGLSYLLSVQPDRELQQWVLECSASPDPSERFLVARYSPLYSKTVPELYWDVLRARADAEQNAVVLLGVLEALGLVGPAADGTT